MTTTTTYEITLDEYRALVRNPPKYGNSQKEERDNIRFDSKAEAERYEQLRLLVTAGAISDLVVHPRYELQPAFLHHGKRYRAVFYEADFSYTENGQAVVEDTKGARTKEFIIKEKLFRFRYPDCDLRIIDV